MRTVFDATFIAFGFVLWPMIGAYAQMTSGWIGTIAMLATSATAAVFAGKQLAVMPDLKACMIVVCAGVLNGVAIHRYTINIAAGEISRASFVALVSVLMIVVACVLDWVLNHATLSIYKAIGIACTICGILFLTMFD